MQTPLVLSDIQQVCLLLPNNPCSVRRKTVNWVERTYLSIIGLSRLFQKIYQIFYSRFLHHFPYYSSILDLLFSRCWSFTTGPTLTLRRWVTVTPLSHEIRQSWGLQSIKYRSRGTWWSFVDTRGSFTDTRRSFADRVSHVVHTVRVPCWFQFNAHAQYALHNIFRYILPIILV